MTTPETVKPGARALILNAEEWLDKEFSVNESEVLLGTTENPLLRPLTKNLIQAPEKAFKTTFLLRLALGLSTGETVFSSLPVKRACRVLYLHGELAPAELKERLQEAAAGLKRPLEHFFQGRSLNASLVTTEGQAAIRQHVEEYKPEILVLDPWQSFIAGADENSFKEVSAATSFLDMLIAEYRVTILFAVHLGKNRQRGARGHSLLAGWRDTKFELHRDENTLTVDVEPRWAKPPDAIKLTFRRGTLWEGNGPHWTPQVQSIRSLLRAHNGALSRTQVGLTLGLDDSALRMALRRARKCGAIDLQGDTVRLLGLS